MDMRIISYALIAVMAAVWLFMAFKKRTTFTRLQRLLSEHDYDGFDALLAHPLTKMLYPDYNIRYLKLNSLLIQEDLPAAEQLFEELLARRLGRAQRTDLVLKAFNFYLGRDNGKRSGELLEQIDRWDAKFDAIKRECRQMYEIVHESSCAYIDEMEADLERASGMKRGRLEYALALQYGNRGDVERRDDYLKRAADDSFTPQKR